MDGFESAVLQRTIEAPVPPPPRSKVSIRCAVSGIELPAAEATKFSTLRPSLAERIKVDHPRIGPDDFIGSFVLGEYRVRYVEELLTRGRGTVSEVERQVIESLREHEITAADVEAGIERRRSLGDRLSDAVALFGGSWMFVICLGVVVAGWIALGIAAAAPGRIDVYPFIVLDLLLSGIAGLEAPIILMSLRRQAANDRQRSQNDYRVNLKTELELRHVHEKLDHLLTLEWERGAELRQLQSEMIAALERTQRVKS